MADYQIDELSLKIDIQGANKKNAENIRDIASAIRSLNKAVSNSGALNNLKAYSKNLQKLAGSIRSSFADIKSGTAAGTVTPKMVEVGGKNNKQNTDKLPKAQTGTSNRKNLAQNQKNLNKALNDTEKSGKKAASGWSKFTKSIGRIAMYRAIRAVLKSITQAMVEGVQNYAKYSDSANKAISNIRNSFQQVKDSFGVTLGYLLEAFEPVITAISDGVVQLAENINMALASMSGKSTYSKAIKQNEDYAKSLDKVNNKLLSFDKFESLNKGDNNNEPRYEEVELGDEPNESATALKAVFEIVQEGLGVLKEIWDILQPAVEELLPMLQPILSSVASLVKTILPIVSKILKPILEFLEPIMSLLEAIFQIVEVIIKLLEPFIDEFVQNLTIVLQWIGAIADQLSGAIKIISGLIKLLTGDFKGAFADIKDGFNKMLNGMINMFINFINFIIQAINVVLKPLDWIIGGVGKLLGKNWGLQIPKIPEVNLKAFANGGVPEVGSMFYAGEAGAEIVSTSRSGQTGVANVEQISQAMLQALINYNAAQNGQSGGGNVYLNGRQVGQLVEDSVYREGVRVGHFKRA